MSCSCVKRGRRASFVVDARGKGVNTGDFELREENGERHSGEDGEMEGRTGGGAERLRRIRAGGPADAGGGSGASGRAKSGGGTKDGADVAGILNTSQNHQEWGAGRRRSAHQFVERRFVRSYERGDALRMFGVGKTFKEPVSGAQYGEAQFGAIDDGRDTFAMPLAGLAEEQGLNGTAGAQRFLDEAEAFDADETAFGGEAAAEGHTKLLEPAIVAAGEERGLPRGTNVTHGSAGHC